MRKILFLSVIMQKGYGVSVALEKLIPELRKLGMESKIVACSGEADWVIGERIQGLSKIVLEYKPDYIIAITSPFFEILPDFSAQYSCWAFECGDPTPELFIEDRAKRQEVKRLKTQTIYPKLSGGVISISDFVKHDIGWKEAKTVYLGSDHVPDMGEKKVDLHGRPLRIGTLMRIGRGEALYKGNQIFLDIVRIAKEYGLNIEPHVAGRGSEEDAFIFQKDGIKTHLNLSDDEKFQYLRSLDIFISCSLWEGFNLPVVEAAASATLSLCFDIGAHPEVCPYILSRPMDALNYIEKAVKDSNFLERASNNCYHFVREKFLWGKTASDLLNIIVS